MEKKQVMNEELIVSEEARNNLDEKTAELYLSQAEKNLEQVIQWSEKATERGYILLTAIITLLGCFSWVINKGEGWFVLLLSSIGIGVCCFCSIVLLWKVICIHQIWFAGRAPSEMNINEFTNYYKETAPDKQYINVIADELNVIEHKIRENEKDTQKRVRYYGICLKVALTGIITISTLLLLKGLIPLVWPYLLHWFGEVCQG